jgi:hypothetical protein
VSLLDGRYERVPAFDSSLRSDDTRYKVLGRATVLVHGAPDFDKVKLNAPRALDELFCRGAAHRKQADALWNDLFSQQIIHPGVKDFYLRRMTMKRLLPEGGCPSSLEVDAATKRRRPMVELASDETAEAAQTTADLFIEKHNFLLDVKEDYLAYLYQHCCEVKGTTVDEMEAVLLSSAVPGERQLVQFCEVMGLMLLAGALATYYTGDKAAGLDCERFSGACFSREGQGDCEDDGCAIFTAFYWFRRSSHFGGLRRLLDAYECLLCTGAATQPQAGNVNAANNNNNDEDPVFICHVWAMLVPKPVLGTWSGDRLSYRSRDRLHSAVKVMMMEGTAPAPVFGLHKGFYFTKEPEEAARQVQLAKNAAVTETQVVAAVPELKEFVCVPFKSLAQEPKVGAELSDFYVYVISAFVNNPGGPRTFHFKHQGKIGVSLIEVMRGDRKVQLVPHSLQVPFTDLQRRALASFDTPVMPLVKPQGEDVRSEGDGDVGDRSKRAEFFFQRPIEGLAEKLRRVPNYKAYRLREIFIYEGCKLHVLEVFLK